MASWKRKRPDNLITNERMNNQFGEMNVSFDMKQMDPTRELGSEGSDNMSESEIENLENWHSFLRALIGDTDLIGEDDDLVINMLKEGKGMFNVHNDVDESGTVNFEGQTRMTGDSSEEAGLDDYMSLLYDDIKDGLGPHLLSLLSMNENEENGQIVNGGSTFYKQEGNQYQLNESKLDDIDEDYSSIISFALDNSPTAVEGLEPFEKNNSLDNGGTRHSTLESSTKENVGYSHRNGSDEGFEWAYPVHQRVFDVDDEGNVMVFEKGNTDDNYGEIGNTLSENGELEMYGCFSHTDNETKLDSLFPSIGELNADGQGNKSLSERVIQDTEMCDLEKATESSHGSNMLTGMSYPIATLTEQSMQCVSEQMVRSEELGECSSVQFVSLDAITASNTAAREVVNYNDEDWFNVNQANVPETLGSAEDSVNKESLVNLQNLLEEHNKEKHHDRLKELVTEGCTDDSYVDPNIENVRQKMVNNEVPSEVIEHVIQYHNTRNAEERRHLELTLKISMQDEQAKEDYSRIQKQINDQMNISTWNEQDPSFQEALEIKNRFLRDVQLKEETRAKDTQRIMREANQDVVKARRSNKTKYERGLSKLLDQNVKTEKPFKIYELERDYLNKKDEIEEKYTDPTKKRVMRNELDSHRHRYSVLVADAWKHHYGIEEPYFDKKSEQKLIQRKFAKKAKGYPKQPASQTLGRSSLNTEDVIQNNESVTAPLSDTFPLLRGHTCEHWMNDMEVEEQFPNEERRLVPPVPEITEERTLMTPEPVITEERRLATPVPDFAERMFESEMHELPTNINHNTEPVVLRNLEDATQRPTREAGDSILSEAMKQLDSTYTDPSVKAVHQQLVNKGVPDKIIETVIDYHVKQNGTERKYLEQWLHLSRQLERVKVDNSNALERLPPDEIPQTANKEPREKQINIQIKELSKLRKSERRSNTWRYNSGLLKLFDSNCTTQTPPSVIQEEENYLKDKCRLEETGMLGKDKKARKNQLDKLRKNYQNKIVDLWKAHYEIEEPQFDRSTHLQLMESQYDRQAEAHRSPRHNAGEIMPPFTDVGADAVNIHPEESTSRNEDSHVNTQRSILGQDGANEKHIQNDDNHGLAAIDEQGRERETQETSQDILGEQRDTFNGNKQIIMNRGESADNLSNDDIGNSSEEETENSLNDNNITEDVREKMITNQVPPEIREYVLNYHIAQHKEDKRSYKLCQELTRKDKNAKEDYWKACNEVADGFDKELKNDPSVQDALERRHPKLKKLRLKEEDRKKKMKAQIDKETKRFALAKQSTRDKYNLGIAKMFDENVTEDKPGEIVEKETAYLRDKTRLEERRKLGKDKSVRQSLTNLRKKYQRDIANIWKEHYKLEEPHGYKKYKKPNFSKDIKTKRPSNSKSKPVRRENVVKHRSSKRKVDVTQPTNNNEDTTSRLTKETETSDQHSDLDSVDSEDVAEPVTYEDNMASTSSDDSGIQLDMGNVDYQRGVTTQEEGSSAGHGVEEVSTLRKAIGQATCAINTRKRGRPPTHSINAEDKTKKTVSEQEITKLVGRMESTSTMIKKNELRTRQSVLSERSLQEQVKKRNLRSTNLKRKAYASKEAERSEHADLSSNKYTKKYNESSPSNRKEIAFNNRQQTAKEQEKQRIETEFKNREKAEKERERQRKETARAEESKDAEKRSREKQREQYVPDNQYFQERKERKERKRTDKEEHDAKWKQVTAQYGRQYC